MNILMMNYDLEIGGQEAHVRDLCNHLVAEGHEIELWTKGGPLIEELVEVNHYTVRFDTLIPWPANKMAQGDFRSKVTKFRRDFHSTLTRHCTDIIHCHGVTEVTLTRAALGKRPIPLLYSSHGWPDSDWGWHMRYLGRCDHYIGVSDFTCRKLQKFGVPPRRISRIPCGIPYRVVPLHSEIERIRAAILGDCTNAKIVVTVARLHRQKGHDVLLRAISYVRQKFANVVFAFVGDGEERTRLKELAQGLGCLDAIRFVGMQRDVIPYLHASDIFCLPSRYEALPLSIPEAYRAGLPVVVTRTAGCPEIVEHGRTGLIVPPESPEELAQALLRLLCDSEYCQCLASAALAYGYMDRFDPVIIHRQIAILYSRLAKRQPNRLALSPFERTLASAMRTGR